MEIRVLANPKDFEDSLAAARQQPQRVGRELEAQGRGALLGRIEEVWDAMEEALARAYRQGMEKARDAIERAAELAEQLLEEAKEAAAEVHAELVRRMNVFLDRFVSSALAHVRSTLQVGGQPMALAGIEVQQRVTLSGSMKASLAELCSMATSGEFAVSASYSIAR